MVDDTRFKINVDKLDSSTRTCILFLIAEINKLKVQRRDIHPDIVNAINQHDREIKKLSDINNILVKQFDSLEVHYKNTLDLDKRISDIILRNIDEGLEKNQRIMDENVAKANMEFRKIEKIRDQLLDRFLIMAKRLNIDISLTDEGRT